MTHRWTGVKSLSRVWDDDIEPGEEFEPTDAELRAFSGNIEELEEEEDAEDDYTCAEGDCSRTVDGPNVKCWQHSDDE